MNTKGKASNYKAQQDIFKGLQTNSGYTSNLIFNLPVKPYKQSSHFQLNLAREKQYLSDKLRGKGFTGRQYSLSYLQITPKLKQNSRARANISSHSRDNSIDVLEKKYIEALNRAKMIGTERRQKGVVRHQYVSKSPINSQLKLNTELLKKKTQQFIIERRAMKADRSPLRPRTPDCIQIKERMKQKMTPNRVSKPGSCYMMTKDSLPGKSPSRNAKCVYKNNSNLYEATHCKVESTQIEGDAFSRYQFLSTRTKVNEKKPTRTPLKDVNAKREYKKCSFIKKTFHKEGNIKKANCSSISHCAQSNNSNSASVDAQSKKELIRLSKPTTSTFILPEEAQIDFNQLDQFSPPYISSINFNLNTSDKILSPAGSTTYTTIDQLQDKPKVTSSLPPSNKQIINNFLKKLPSSNCQYSTLEYNHVASLNDFNTTQPQLNK